MNIDIKIKKPVKTKKRIDCYMLEIEFMHGDADRFEKENIGPFKNNPLDIEELKDAIIVCERMRRLFEDGKGGCDFYNEDLVPGYDKWFDEEKYEDTGNIENHLAISVPYDDDYQASLEDYEVFYYDKNGNKCNVEIILSEEN